MKETKKVINEKESNFSKGKGKGIA